MKKIGKNDENFFDSKMPKIKPFRQKIRKSEKIPPFVSHQTGKKISFWLTEIENEKKILVLFPKPVSEKKNWLKTGFMRFICLDEI